LRLLLDDAGLAACGKKGEHSLSDDVRFARAGAVKKVASAWQYFFPPLHAAVFGRQGGGGGGGGGEHGRSRARGDARRRRARTRCACHLWRVISGRQLVRGGGGRRGAVQHAARPGRLRMRRAA
jgi:hypothetical protein